MMLELVGTLCCIPSICSCSKQKRAELNHPLGFNRCDFCIWEWLNIGFIELEFALAKVKSNKKDMHSVCYWMERESIIRHIMFLYSYFVSAQSNVIC